MLHANIAKIERSLAGIKDKSANLRAVVEADRLQNTPSLKSLVTHCIKKEQNSSSVCFFFNYTFIYNICIHSKCQYILNTFLLV